MELVFSTHDFPASKRYDAWREALCGTYVNVDSVRDDADDYNGFIRRASFGQVTVTDCYLSPQTIMRRKSHLAHVDKDCYYVALMMKGRQRIEQNGLSISNASGTGVLFSAAEPYTLNNSEDYRALYLEFPRAALAQRNGAIDGMYAASLNLSFGLGRVIADVCGSMVLEAESLHDRTRECLGEQVLDLLAIAVKGGPEKELLSDRSVQSARLRQINRYIDANIGNPLLNPERIAKSNQLSVRALHYLFKSTGQSVSDYIWEHRLERCREELELPAATPRSLTDIALSSGFNSMSHFNSMFKRRFGMTPS